MKLNKTDLYFITNYYFEELKGEYPTTKWTGQDRDDTCSVLLKHFLHKILGINNSMQIIDLLYHQDKNEIRKETYIAFPELEKRADCQERILCLANNLRRIKAAIKASQVSVEIPQEILKEKKSSIKDLTDLPAYDSIEEYEQKTSKRFRMRKDQKQKGLTRQQAFQEIYGIFKEV